MIRWSRTLWLGSFLALLILVVSGVEGRKQATPEPSPAKATKLKDSEPEIEEVTAKQLERVLNEKDFVAVFWCEFHFWASCTALFYAILRIYCAE